MATFFHVTRVSCTSLRAQRSREFVAQVGQLQVSLVSVAFERGRKDRLLKKR